MFAALGTTLLALFSLVNFIALPVGAVWLCIMGHWKLVVLWFFVSMLSPRIIGFVTLPVFGLQAVAAALIVHERSFFRPMFGSMLIFASILIYAIVFGAWSLVSFTYVTGAVSERATIPGLLFALAVAVWPTQAMTDPRDPGVQETLSLLCSTVEVIGMSLVLLFHVGAFRWYLTVCLLAVGVCVPIQAWIASRTTGEFLISRRRSTRGNGVSERMPTKLRTP
jgi:hypothetical protein